MGQTVETTRGDAVAYRVRRDERFDTSVLQAVSILRWEQGHWVASQETSVDSVRRPHLVQISMASSKI